MQKVKARSQHRVLTLSNKVRSGMHVINSMKHNLELQVLNVNVLNI